MEFKKFNFDPPEGFRDSGYYEDTPVNAREVLQRQHDQVKDYINGMVDILNSKKEGESGSEHIASPKIDGVDGENVFSQIKSIKRQLLDASAGSINDGSVTSVKLASQSVTDEKIATGSIKNEHFSKDAQCPYANETKMINGVPARLYQPVNLASDFKTFKERVSDVCVSGIYGKTIGDYRYFTDNNGIIKKLSLEDGSVEEVADFGNITTSPVVYDTDDNGDLYIGFLDFSDASNVIVCFYKHENNETYPVIRLPIAPVTGTSNVLDDILIIGDDLYALYTVGVYLGYHMLYLYKYSLSGLEDAEESVYVFSDRMRTKKMNGKLFVADGDMYFHNYRIKDMDFGSFDLYDWYFLGESKGKFYVYHSNYVLVDEKMLPCMALARDLDDEGIPYDSFIRGDYIYRQLSDYLFRSRIM